MSLPPGTRIGAFQIVRPLGAGGMGEVYLALDPPLQRQVALKLLRAELTGDVHRVARFELEARAASALAHPNICHIYQVGETPEGRRFVAMEYVEGETLEARLTGPPLPLGEALDIAIQIASALTAAHAQGIVHRDVKPANVLVRRDRLVKVLDFGVAKLVPSPGAAARHAPTQSPGDTESGSMVGTADYMAPEQARGHEVDGRTDIWALGVVLYEMLAGRHPFPGLPAPTWWPRYWRRTRRPWHATADLARGTAPHRRQGAPQGPRAVRAPAGHHRAAARGGRSRRRVGGIAIGDRILMRYQMMKDLLLDLAALRDGIARSDTGLATDPEQRLYAADHAAAAPLVAPREPAGTGGPRLLTLARLAGAFAIAGVAALTGWWIAPRQASGIRYTVDLKLEGLEVFGDTGSTSPALSPDGRWLLYRADGRLWLRALDEFTSKPLPDSAGAVYPFWSPDSRQVAFVRDRRIWRLPIDGANATMVGDAPEGLSGSGSGVWTEEGNLVLAGSDTVSLLSTAVRDGQGREILPLDKANETDFHHVAALPHGRGLLVAVHRSGGSDTIVAFVNGRRHRVLQLPGEAISFPLYSPAGYLLFERSTTSPGIWAVPFSLDRLATEGSPFLLVAGGTGPTLASDGTLAFLRGWPPPSQLVWIDGTGIIIERLGELQGQLGQGSGQVMALSPDGRRLALSIDSPTGTELWSYDLSRRTATRLTVGATRVTSPIWTPDGRHAHALRLFPSSQELRYLRGRCTGGADVLKRRAH